MMYNTICGALLALNVYIIYLTKYKSKNDSTDNAPNSIPAVMDQSFVAFRFQYLIVYFLMMAGDWLQGPYVYALYMAYGFTKEDIAVLFVIGFGSSMLVGTFVGSLADTWGRKRLSIFYCILYIISCLTKHVNDYNVLLVGRLLGGTATSLLFSVFESWLVCEHHKRGFSPEQLGDIFSLAIFGNSLVAIVCGFFAQAVADSFPMVPLGSDEKGGAYIGGYTSPFDLAIIVLIIGWGLIHVKWSENYGENVGQTETNTGESIKHAVLLVIRNRPILLLGLVQSLFEGAMYSFVFMWSPALTVEGEDNPPFGLIFATFMICCMLGSQAFGYLIALYPPEFILRNVFIVSMLSLATVPIDKFVGTNFTYFGFLLFEVCVGIYFPCQSTIKGSVVPEQSRSTIYNLFRVPLNAIVLFVLLNKFTVVETFTLCSVLLLIATVLQQLLYQISQSATRYTLVPSS